jgi:adenylate cyclase
MPYRPKGEIMQSRLAAILAADMVGYSRLMGTDAAGTVVRQKANRKELIDPAIDSHHGRIFKATGDGFLVEFSSIVDAVSCAVKIQRLMGATQAEVPEDRRIYYRIGINLGEIIEDEGDIFGDGVNIAARIEGLAPRGGLCVSDTVHENLRSQLDISFEDLGEQSLKNIERRVRIWKWSDNSSPSIKESASGGRSSSKEDRTSIAVLPFMNLASTSDHEHLADGITDDLTTELSKIDSLYIVSRTSAFAYKGKTIRATQIGEELGADYIVEGSVQTAGNSVRINAQLIETRGGGHLWAEKFDGSLDAILQFQDQITQKVVSALEVRFSEGEQVRLWRDEAADARAYEHFLRGRAYYKEYSRVGSARAKPQFQAALGITPRFVSAITGLARTHIEDATYGWSASREASLAEAKHLLGSALSMNENHATAHAELAHLLMVSGDYEAARKQAQRATSIDPNSAEAQNVTAFVLLCLNLPGEALSYARNAIRLNPGAPEFYLIVMADAYVMLRRYDEALPLLKRILARRPSWIMARALSVICHEAMGRHDEAHKVASDISEMSSSFGIRRWRRCLHNPDRPDINESAKMLEAAGLPE